MNCKRGFKRLTLVLSFLAGPFMFLLFCREEGALDSFVVLLILEVIGFAAVWIIYWATCWIVTGFLDDKQKDQPYGERVMNTFKIFFISLVLLYVTIKLYDLYQRRQAVLINPDVKIAFRIINMRAWLLSEQDLINKEEYKQYKAVIENKDNPLMESYLSIGESNHAIYKYYKFLTNLGFKLPPYKLTQFVTQSYSRIYMEDYFRLEDAMAMFAEGLTDVEEKEIERIIEETSIRYSLKKVLEE
ncbi:MAG: hypothetical protein ACYS9C_17370 [Planctomycetota bacterium]